MLNAEELNTFIWPQLFPVNDENLNQEAFPGLLNLSRTSLESTGIYVIFNTFGLYIWIGREADPFFLEQLFNVTDLNQLEHLDFSEEELFFSEEALAKGWVQELYAIMQSCRVSQKIYPSVEVLFEHDQQRSETSLRQLMVEDNSKGMDIGTIQKLLRSTGPSMAPAMPY